MAGLASELKANYGPSGLGSVRFNKQYVKVVSEGGDTWTISYENVDPTIVQTHRKACYFQLSPDETVLMAMRPWDGRHVCQFAGFTRRGEEEEAEPFMRKGGKRERPNPKSGKISKWVEPDRLRFTAVFTIVGGDWEDNGLLYGIDYLFRRASDGSTILSSNRAGWLERLENFLDLCGFDRDSESIPFSDNVLPYLEALLLERAKKNPIWVQVENGWPRAIERVPTGLSW